MCSSEWIYVTGPDGVTYYIDEDWENEFYDLAKDVEMATSPEAAQEAMVRFLDEFNNFAED